MFQTTGGQEPPLLQLTLSAIYLVNACRHQGDTYRARCAERRALTSLHLAEGGTWENQSLREHYASIIRDTGRHEAFFRDYLNLPFEPLDTLASVARRH
ncbi:hypothetical protein CF392_07465 [Tamilnaduibacter salinus]|uniref:Uncharacterized protein n=1 Tax=Tamilnaduibacter salinus TaxID=1484056 RepID=A0A2A2I4S3_9GAMM|nr:hypothetical protein [Tamilnaduibacter salinus]PAV26120.1 hypothetical protein CF392_07465 [Tamilnaduibacter salinus]